ncbi:MAG: asparagine synthase-related protein [Acidobacteriota bacterium]
MTGLFGYVPVRDADARAIAEGMACALRASPDERWAIHTEPGLAIGVLDGIAPERVREWAAPVETPDGAFALWCAGEVFDAPYGPRPPHETATPEARRRLLAWLVEKGLSAVRAVDGEYHIALWHRPSRRLTLLGDRFGGLPWYTGRSAEGAAFAPGVRGVLMAPDIDAGPDVDALREALTFGGFRLGTRTNVRGVSMLPGAAAVEVSASATRVQRYWTWNEVHERPVSDVDAALDEAGALFEAAVRRRLSGAARPGQTLSGGLDSRAILAEATRQGAPWTAMTYGVRGCEDARYAARAARACGARWQFQPLYADDWFARRASFVQATDGLIQLQDLMHLETLDWQRAELDVHLSGYIGDAVSGPTFNAVASREDAMLALPYYETPISLGWHNALARVEAMTADARWLASRFLLFEHKLPQSTNRWTAAWRPYVRVRKPFTDYAVFDFSQSLPAALRGGGRFYERWLRRRYPAAFRHIPNHKTGAPVLASPAGLFRARVGRQLWRAVALGAAACGLPRPWSRLYHDEPRQWRTVRPQMEDIILRPGSVAVEAFGRPAVAAVLRAWFEREEGPTQVVGALYVFEAYHAGLPGHLSAARVAARAAVERGRGSGQNGGQPWA